MDVIGIVGVAAGSVSIPLAGLVGISQGVSGQQRAGAREEDDKDDPRVAKFNLLVASTDSSPARNLVLNKTVVLREGKLYLDAIDENHRIFENGHAFSGFYLDYPAGSKGRGLVSTISKNPPELNWIYADRNDGALKCGNKTQSIDHVHGPWDWTQNQSALMLEDWEGFLAVEESPGVWYVAYDANDDHLASLGLKRRVVEISLERHLEPPKA
ncbi:hypothetical protein BKA70DRAFT_1370755 [Coprinopsis sp. MPI-PUGE-AT-0042]|nr:hypothetical protein BKA70DRAFT_1370755 [Coprinopsis sp. MPI-PUGE-AT-0042]